MNTTVDYPPYTPGFSYFDRAFASDRFFCLFPQYLRSWNSDAFKIPTVFITYRFHEISGQWSFMAEVLNLHLAFYQVGVMAGTRYLMHVTRVIDLQSILRT